MAGARLRPLVERAKGQSWGRTGVCGLGLVGSAVVGHMTSAVVCVG